MKRLIAIALVALCCGCITEYTGSRTVVGEQMAFPEVSNLSDSITLRIYESVKGAKVWTAKDSKVTINYSNSYTNSYFGICETRDSMKLDVIIKPLAVERPEAEETASAQGEN